MENPTAAQDPATAGVAPHPPAAKAAKRGSVINVPVKFEVPNPDFNPMSDLIWGKRSGEITAAFKSMVIDAVYKFDSKISPGEMWKIRRCQEVGRERRRGINIERKKSVGKGKAFDIWKKKLKIRALKERVRQEKERAEKPVDWEAEKKKSAANSTLLPLKLAEKRVSFMKSIFNHMTMQSVLPAEIRRTTTKYQGGAAPPGAPSSPTRVSAPPPTFFSSASSPSLLPSRSSSPPSSSTLDRPGSASGGDRPGSAGRGGLGFPVQPRREAHVFLPGKKNLATVELFRVGEEHGAKFTPTRDKVDHDNRISFVGKALPANLHRGLSKPSEEAQDVSQSNFNSIASGLFGTSSRPSSAASSGHPGSALSSRPSSALLQRGASLSSLSFAGAPTSPNQRRVSVPLSLDLKTRHSQLRSRPDAVSFEGERLTPREVYIRGRAIVTIQSIFRGRKARQWIDNQAQRLFPLYQAVSVNWLEGGNALKSRAIFLNRKNFLMHRGDKILRPLREAAGCDMDLHNPAAAAARDKDVPASLASKANVVGAGDSPEDSEPPLFGIAEEESSLCGSDVSGAIDTIFESRAAARGTPKVRVAKDVLSNDKVRRRLDEEALMLHKNMRFIAACIVQHFCRTHILRRYPHLKKVLDKKRKDLTVANKKALTVNKSRDAFGERHDRKKREAAAKFGAFPIIVKMQRTWREYLNIKYSKRETAKALALLKRMRDDRKEGQHFFKKLKDAHRHEIELAVEYNLGKRHQAIVKSFRTLAANALDRRARKAWVRAKVQRRKAAVLCLWFKEIMQEKRIVISKVKPNLFPPMLAEYVRFLKDNDWRNFLARLSDLFSDFDVGSVVHSLQFEEYTTNKVIGFNSFEGGLNEMLTYHIAKSGMRKRVVCKPNEEASLSFQFWRFLLDVSIYMQKCASETAARNAERTKHEETDVVGGLLFNFLLRKNLNPYSLSSKFRMRSKMYLKWYRSEELCSKCISVLPMLSSKCTKCHSEQMPRFMRNTCSTLHSNTPGDGIPDKSGIIYAKRLRKSKDVIRNEVNDLGDIDDPLDLFVYQCMMSCLAPVGGWRRKDSPEDMWSISVLTAAGTVQLLKRRGVLTIADLHHIENGTGYFEGFDDPRGLDKVITDDDKLRDKIRDMLFIADSLLKEALTEEGVVKFEERDVFGDSAIGLGSFSKGSTRSGAFDSTLDRSFRPRSAPKREEDVADYETLKKVSYRPVLDGLTGRRGGVSLQIKAPVTSEKGTSKY